MKKLLLPVILLIGFTQCTKHATSPKYVEKVLYSGDSVRYNLDSLPAPLPDAPPDFSDYYRLVQVYTNQTMIVDYTHVLGDGKSVNFRMFVRYASNYDLKGWYEQRIADNYILPANRDVTIYHTTPYNGPVGP